MRGECTAGIKQDGDWWIGWVEEIPGVNCQERTRKEEWRSIPQYSDIGFSFLELTVCAGRAYRSLEGEGSGRSTSFSL